MRQYDFKSIEAKWRKYWDENEVYKSTEKWDKPKFYILDMFPYPSWEWLHVWHPKWYIATDIIARKKMMEWYNVLHPMWWDAFWLPAENYAIKNKIHPSEAVVRNVGRFKSQLENIWFTFDWSREINTTDPSYYKWTQWIFLKLYSHYYDDSKNKAMPIENLSIPAWLSEDERRAFVDSKRLAYVDYSLINWCPSCMTWLSNEDLEDWKCERCGSYIERRPMRQWVLRITKYAERMLNDLDLLPQWEQSIVEMQRNWIGKSTWVEFRMDIKWSSKSFDVYTTRVDTVFWMTFVVLAPENPLVKELENKILNLSEVNKYIDDTRKKSDLQRTDLNKDKTWVRLDWVFAINPFSWNEIPVFIWDYVLANYWTWAVMAVPAHDERDYEFAKKYDLEIIESISWWDISEEAFTEDWILVNSSQFDWLTSKDAREKMWIWLEDNGLWRRKTNYKIQEWVFSRQRYWWDPIPMVHCEKCWVVPMHEQDLPLLLPDVENYEPTWTEEWPLSAIDSWINVKCPKCNWNAKRESNTMPQWAWSSWYWLRYMDPTNDNALVWKEAESYWNEVDIYVWWAEHATRHLIYARFWHKFLYDIWAVSTSEPFKKLQHVWLILAEDWRKMSKRWGNVINPDDIITEYWADSLRVYEAFMWPFAQEVAWSTAWVKWVKRFLDKVVLLSDKLSDSEDDKKIVSLFNRTIKKFWEDIDAFKFNTAVASMMTLVNEWSSKESVNKTNFKSFLKLLAPFAPHLSEELLEELELKESVFKSKWPSYDTSKLDDETVIIAIQVNWKVRWELEIDFDSDEQLVKTLAFENENVMKYIANCEIKKIVYVKNKLLSIVV